MMLTPKTKSHVPGGNHIGYGRHADGIGANGPEYLYSAGVSKVGPVVQGIRPS
jgi:hypothetical protein